jgi:HEAT repeat protein
LKVLESDPLLKTQAAYGLGSNAFRLKEQRPELANEVHAHLAAKLNEATTDRQRVVRLTALGNAGHRHTPAVVRPYAASASPEVRAQAAQALRRVSGLDAEAILVELSKDGMKDVRISAIDAMGERPPSEVLAQRLADVMRSDAERTVRAKAIQTAGIWFAPDPALMTSLRAVAASDEADGLRRMAATALSKLEGAR